MLNKYQHVEQEYYGLLTLASSRGSNDFFISNYFRTRFSKKNMDGNSNFFRKKKVKNIYIGILLGYRGD